MYRKMQIESPTSIQTFRHDLTPSDCTGTDAPPEPSVEETSPFFEPPLPEGEEPALPPTELLPPLADPPLPEDTLPAPEPLSPLVLLPLPPEEELPSPSPGRATHSATSSVGNGGLLSLRKVLWASASVLISVSRTLLPQRLMGPVLASKPVFALCFTTNVPGCAPVAPSIAFKALRWTRNVEVAGMATRFSTERMGQLAGSAVVTSLPAKRRLDAGGNFAMSMTKWADVPPLASPGMTASVFFVMLTSMG